MSKSTLGKIGLLGAALLVVGVILYQIPGINSRVSWRLDIARTYIRNVINPIGQMPTPLPQPVAAVTSFPTQTPTDLPTAEIIATATPGPTPTRTAPPTPLPQFI
ncbi:MAG: hypothetical protein JSW42_08920, partial [Chloroflexota bacterium]